MNINEAKEIYKDAKEIVDTDSEILIFYEINGYEYCKMIKKPRNPFETTAILVSGGFPKKFLDEIYSPFETKCLKIVEKASKGVVLLGPAGIGKSFACIYKIMTLVRDHFLNAPCYLPLQEVITEDYKHFKKYDSYLLDDINANLPNWKIDFLRSVIYHAYNEKKTLFITTNLNKAQFLKLLSEEPIISRLFEMCEFHEVKDKDYRVKKCHLSGWTTKKSGLK